MAKALLSPTTLFFLPFAGGPGYGEGMGLSPGLQPDSGQGEAAPCRPMAPLALIMPQPKVARPDGTHVGQAVGRACPYPIPNQLAHQSQGPTLRPPARCCSSASGERAPPPPPSPSPQCARMSASCRVSERRTCPLCATARRATRRRASREFGMKRHDEANHTSARNRSGGPKAPTARHRDYDTRPKPQTARMFLPAFLDEF